jgi:hypothetical protein
LVGTLEGQQAAASMVPGILEMDSEPGFDLQDRAILTSESEILKPCWFRAMGVVRQSPATGRVALSLIRRKHHDWLSSQTNIRATGAKS